MSNSNPALRPLTYLGVEFLVDYGYEKGEPPTGPSYASGGEPGYPASVEIYNAFIGETCVMPLLEDTYAKQGDAFVTLQQALEEALLEEIETEDD